MNEGLPKNWSTEDAATDGHKESFRFEALERPRKRSKTKTLSNVSMRNAKMPKPHFGPGRTCSEP